MESSCRVIKSRYVLLIAHLSGEQMAKIYKGMTHFYPECFIVLYNWQKSDFGFSELPNMEL
jgi:hypothetical protein